MGFSPARREAIENADHLTIVELMEIGVEGVVRLEPYPNGLNRLGDSRIS